MCIVQNEQLVVEKCLDEGLTHSQTLLPLIQHALQEASLAIENIDLFAVAAGPGSFTGLRIALALVKGLALAGRVPVAPVSTLCAMALASGVHGLVLPAINARRQEVYWGLYECGESGCTQLVADTAGPAKDLLKHDILMKLQQDPVILVGDGAQICYNQISCTLKAVIQPTMAHSLSYGVALAGNTMWSQHKALPASGVAPVYLRLSQAERERAAREGTAKP